MTGKKRIQLDFAPRSVQRLDRLKLLCEATSYGEVIANALRLYEYCIDEGGHNAKLVIEKPDGTTAIVRLFI